MVTQKAIALFFIILFAPLAAQSQSADSLRLLWKNEAISGVTAHAFSHSGKILALANDHEIKLWDLQASKFVKTISLPHYGYTRNYVYVKMAFTPDDSEIVLLDNPWNTPYGWCPTGERPPPGFELRVNAISGESFRVKGISEMECEWALSPDGSLIAVLADSGVLSLHDAKSFQEIVHTRLSENSSSRNRYHRSNGVWFGSGLGSIVSLYQCQLTIRDPITLDERTAITNTTKHGLSSYCEIESVMGDGIFPGGDSVMFETSTGHLSDLQPRNLPKSVQDVDGTPSPRTAVLFDSGNFISAQYVVRCFPPHSDCGNGVTVRDSLIISSRAHPEGEWGMLIDPAMHIMDEMPDGESLLLSDGNTFMTLNARTRKIDYLGTSKDEFIGFGNTDNAFLKNASGELIALDAATGKTEWTLRSSSKNPFHISPDGEMVAQIQNDQTIAFTNMHGQTNIVQKNLDGYPLFWDFLNSDLLLANNKMYQVPTMCCEQVVPFRIADSRFLPLGQNEILLYGNGDTAYSYDLRNGVQLERFVGGLNSGISSATVSRDGKWLVTVRTTWEDIRLWRVSDGALVSCFNLGKPLDFWSNAKFQFAPNDHYLVIASKNKLLCCDLHTDNVSTLDTNNTGISSLALSHDGTRLALVDGEGGISVYETPAEWRSTEEPFTPAHVYLPLRFYLPKDAPDALDTNEMPYTPPRTHVELELRYDDGRLLKKILDGPFHKGKWHLWEFDMTDYPKGTYIMHTEIGGVVKDEAMEVK